MKIKNIDLNVFSNYISTHSLSSTEGRMRNRLKKILQDKIQDYENERLELVKEHSRKDDLGNPITLISVVNGEEKSVGDIVDMNLFNISLNALLHEYVYIEENLSNKQMLETMKTVILNDSKEYSGQEAEIWEFSCELVEQINYPSSEEGVQPHVGD